MLTYIYAFTYVRMYKCMKCFTSVYLYWSHVISYRVLLVYQDMLDHKDKKDQL